MLVWEVSVILIVQYPTGHLIVLEQHSPHSHTQCKIKNGVHGKSMPITVKLAADRKQEEPIAEAGSR